MDPARAHPSKRQLSVLVALIVAVATPATLALSYYRLSGDPSFQPLALTVERLVAGGIEVNHKAVRATILCDDSAEGMTRAARLGQMVQAAFYGKGTEALIRFVTTGPPSAPTVTFQVGNSTFGPFTEAEASRGIGAAVEALHLSRSTGLSSLSRDR